MAVVLSVTSLLVEQVVGTPFALRSGEPAWSLLRDLNRTFQQNSPQNVREPLRDLMNQMTLGGGDSERGIAPAHLARTLINVIERLNPLVEATQRDRLLEAKESLADFAGSLGTTTPASGVFLRRQLMSPKAMGDLVDKQFAEAKLTAGDGILAAAADTLSFLQAPQMMMNRHAAALCALETEFAEITPIGSIEGRLDFVQAALEPVTEISEKIDGIFAEIADMQRALSGASRDEEEAARVVQSLAARGGKADAVRKKLQRVMRSDIAQLLLKLRRTELERWVEENLIADETRRDYERHLKELRAQLKSMHTFMELGLQALDKFLQIGVISRQRGCPFPVDLSEHLNEEFLRLIVGKNIDLKLNADAPRWSVPGPSESIWQVIMNLVNNARQSMNGTGKLRISILPVQLTDVEAARRAHQFSTGSPRAGEYMMLSIRDSGPGVSPDALPRVFDLFHGARANGHRLAATRQIIEDMGGFIGVDSSTGDPRGNVFTIYFPRAG